MILTWIFVGVIVVSLGIIIFIIGKKFPQLKTLDISTISKEKEKQTKDQILIGRIKRKTSKSREVVLKGLSPAWAKFSDSFKGLYTKLQDLEKKYKREEVKNVISDAPEFKKKIDHLLEEANEQYKKEDFDEAEKKLIEVISLAPQEKRAYKGLGDLYMKKKEYKQALETYKFVLKLDLKGSEQIIKEEEGQQIKTFSNSVELANDYVDLGEVSLSLERYMNAIDYFKKAVQLEPNNPRNLDLLIDSSIKAGNKVLAMEALNALKRINPENQKLNDYLEIIREIKDERNSKGMNYLW